MLYFHGLLLIISCSFTFGIFLSPLRARKVSALKSELLQKVRLVERGLTETPSDRDAIISIIEKLEKLNEVKEPFNSKFVNGNWTMEYTTSDSILGRGGPKKIGPIIQMIDAVKLEAENSETINFLGILPVPRSVKATLLPLTKSKVKVTFRKFFLGPFSFPAPPSAIGELDVTYLDKDMRLSRGDKGGIFVLTK